LATDIEEYAVKMDWNINEAHRANIRYSKLTQDVAKLPPSSWKWPPDNWSRSPAAPSSESIRSFFFSTRVSAC